MSIEHLLNLMRHFSNQLELHIGKATQLNEHYQHVIQLKSEVEEVNTTLVEERDHRQKVEDEVDTITF